MNEDKKHVHTSILQRSFRSGDRRSAMKYKGPVQTVRLDVPDYQSLNLTFEERGEKKTGGWRERHPDKVSGV